MNKVILKGRLTKDVELKKTKNKKEYAVFTVAVPRFKPDETDFISCVSWGDSAEFLKKYFSKGQEILLTGRIKVVNEDEKYSTFVEVDSVEFCGSKKE